jgi:hypothetical protein
VTIPADQVAVCFQFVTKGGAVVDTEPEGFPSISAATRRAEEWMNLEPPSRTIAFVTYEGDGAVVRSGEIEHIAVMRADKMASIYEEAIKASQEETTS